jgi:protein SCO1
MSEKKAPLQKYLPLTILAAVILVGLVIWQGTKKSSPGDVSSVTTEGTADIANVAAQPALPDSPTSDTMSEEERAAAEKAAEEKAAADKIAEEKAAEDRKKAENALPGGFQGLNQMGKFISKTDFVGSYLVITFAYTHCGESCDKTVKAMSDALEELGGKAEKVQPIVITMDTERDTPSMMEVYMKNYNAKMIGLSGTSFEMQGAADNFRAPFTKEKNGDKITIKFNPAIYIFDATGRYVETISAKSSADDIANAVEKAMRSTD